MGGDLRRVWKRTRPLEEGSRRLRRAGRKARGGILLMWIRLSKATGAGARATERELQKVQRGEEAVG